jgi:hypothetical protein
MIEMNGTAQEVKAFVEAHLEGWNHDQWLGFLRHLENLGQDVSDPDDIGLALEQERLRLTLKRSGLAGLGPKRVESITGEYATLQNLREADGMQIAERTGIPRVLAQELAAFLR